MLFLLQSHKNDKIKLMGTLIPGLHRIIQHKHCSIGGMLVGPQHHPPTAEDRTVGLEPSSSYTSFTGLYTPPVGFSETGDPSDAFQ